MNDRKADVKKELGEKKAVDDTLKPKLTQAVEEFKRVSGITNRCQVLGEKGKVNIYKGKICRH